MYAQVCIPIFLFKTFDYIVPKHLKIQNLHIGQSVNVPFRNKDLNGFVVALSKKSEYSGDISYINTINENSFKINKELWQTIIWISKYYCTPIGKVLNTTIAYQHMNNFSYPQKKIVSITNNGIHAITSNNIKFKNQINILKFLLSKKNEIIYYADLKNQISSYNATCNRLHQLGLIKFKFKKNVLGLTQQKLNQKKSTILTNNQEKVYQNIVKHHQENNTQPIVLSGVSSSGKTIVYQNIIDKTLKDNKTVIVMVPEIALLSQIYARLSSYFPHQVGLWHNQMQQSEKKYILSQIKQNNLSIMIVTRSGLFLPLKKLGLIIVDEEHSSSYKQEANAPLYHARDVAIIRAKYSKSMILLVSSTPGLETYYNIANKKYKEFNLDTKYKNYKSPQIKMIDMSKIENYQKNCGIISKTLITHMDEAFQKNEKVILLQNRRGYSYIMKCTNCEKVSLCKQCSSPLITYKNIIKCNHCNFAKTITKKCSECNQNTIEQMGTGTQKIQQILNEIFPDKNIIRYDKETMKKTSNYFNLLKSFDKNDAHVLIGTQMISKGLDFKNVSVIGVINADIGLFQPDFRSGEKVFQMLYQFIGRAGRDNKNSYAIIQTFNPLDQHIKMACQLNLISMYKKILLEREELFYPPFSKLIRIIVKGENQDNAKK